MSGSDRVNPDALPPTEGGERVVASGEEPAPEPPDRRSGEEAVPGEARPALVLPRTIGEIALLALVAWLISQAITGFLVKPFQIPSTSMESTLLIGDRVLVSRLAYRSSSPAAGDIVVFPSVDTSGEDLIKRVVAVGGQSVDVRDGVVFVDGKALVEPYVNTEFPDHYDAEATVTVPPGAIYVMGDNRANSQDSRDFGPVPAASVIGRAFAIYWPLDRIRGL